MPPRERILRWSALVATTGAFGALLAGCLFASFGPGSGGGGGGSSDNGSSDGGAADGGLADAAGVECTIATSTSGLKLCEELSACPEVMVNQGTWMGCGFAPAGKGLFTLECECTGYLCSAGGITTCASATALLQEKNATEVCGQLNSGIAGCSFEGLSGTSH